MWRRLKDVDEPLVRPHLEVLHRLLVDVRAAVQTEDVLLRRKRHGAGDSRAGTSGGLHDFPGALVDDLMIERFEPDADFLSAHKLVNLLLKQAQERRVALPDHPPNAVLATRRSW